MSFGVVCVLVQLLWAVSGQYCTQDGKLGNGNQDRFTYSFCSEKSGDSLGFIILEDDDGSNAWALGRFCMAVPDKPATRGREYTVTVQINNDMSKNGVNYGHPGLVFNFKDAGNYDFVFFRSHMPDKCYGYGYVMDGTMHHDWRLTGRCVGGPPVGRKWHNVKLRVIGRQTRVYLYGNYVATFPHHFPNIARCGPALLKGFKNRVFFRKFKTSSVCKKPSG